MKQEHTCCGKPLHAGSIEHRITRGVYDFGKGSATCPACRKRFVIKTCSTPDTEKNIVYTAEEHGPLTCACGTEIVYAEVRHPMRIDVDLGARGLAGLPGPELVPYCPNCEEPPPQRGSTLIPEKHGVGLSFFT